MARNPSLDDLARYETLCWAAMSHAQAVQQGGRLPSADQLLKARKACQRATLPAGQQMRESPMMQLIAAVDRWAALGTDERRAGAAALGDLAREAAKLAGFME